MCMHFVLVVNLPLHVLTTTLGYSLFDVCLLVGWFIMPVNIWVENCDKQTAYAHGFFLFYDLLKTNCYKTVKEGAKEGAKGRMKRMTKEQIQACFRVEQWKTRNEGESMRMNTGRERAREKDTEGQRETFFCRPLFSLIFQFSFIFPPPRHKTILLLFTFFSMLFVIFPSIVR